MGDAKMAIKGITITAVSSSILVSALEVADANATQAGRSKGGWIRLAKCQGSAAEPYVIAARPVSTDRQVQFSCSCPDYLYRKSKIPGACCKHMSRFFAESATKPGEFWFYKAGVSFVAAVAAEIVGGAAVAQLPIHKHKANEQAA